MRNSLPLSILSLCSGILCVTSVSTAGEEQPNSVKPAAKAPEPKLPATKVVVRQVQDSAQQAAEKQVTEARQRVAETQKRVADLQKQSADTQKQLEESQKALVAAQRELAEAQSRRAAAAQAAATRNYYSTLTGTVRKEVDRTNPVERFLLLTPAGPVIVEASLSIDSQPFHEAREKLVDQIVALADTNRDGKATWAEAIANSRKFVGQVQYFANDAQRLQYQETLDVNRDGLVDRYEARLMIAQRSGGGDFIVSGTAFSGGGYTYNAQGQLVAVGAGNDLRAFLDTDGDGILSAKEIAAAAERLKSRDADDNDVVESGELAGAASTRGGGGAASRGAVRAPASGRVNNPLVLVLGPTASPADLLSGLMSAYGDESGRLTAERFAAQAKLFEQLDSNHDGVLKADEMDGLNRLAPHVRLKVGLGEKGTGMAVESLSAEFEQNAPSNAAVLPGAKLNFSASTGAPRTYDYTATAQQYLNAYDKDQNGYLDKDEMPGQLSANFAMWDANDDGKVYADEIKASFERQLLPQMSQVRATVTAQGNSLFAALDANGDGRLGLREVRQCAERLKALDKNRDGLLSAAEIPVTMNISFGLGNSYGYGVGRPAAGGGQVMTGAKTGPGGASKLVPEWFTRMDRNGDGDITEREFLGTPEQFRKLDANADGFIDPTEAAAASK